MNGETPGFRNGTAGVLIRPPRLYLGALLIAFIGDSIWPAAIPLVGDSAAPVLRIGIGIALAAVGLAIAVLAMRGFQRAGTPVPTPQPTTALVTTGPYRYSRNPIYIGLTLLYAGIAIGADNPWALVLLVPVLLVMRYGVVAREEAYLVHKFGSGYESYRARVRRWL